LLPIIAAYFKQLSGELGMGSYSDFYRRSIEDRDSFWREQAQLVDWQQAPTEICNDNNPPFAKWFVGGRTNLCHNAVAPTPVP
jgi:propionyl-CoA synthetase